MSRAIIKSVLGNNTYLLTIPGYELSFQGQCVTLDEFSVDDVVEIVDIDNSPPHKAISQGNIRILPASGVYTYTPTRTWTSVEDMSVFRATLAKAFFYSAEKNPRWQKECPLYRRGTVASIMNEEFMLVNIWSFPLSTGAVSVNVKCWTQYMSCDTSAFSPGDEVVVMFEDNCVEKPVVVGFWDNPQSCAYSFTLSRGDGQAITLAWLISENLAIRFIVYNSSNVAVKNASANVSWVTTGLSHDGNKWTLDASEFTGDPDSSGHWIDYRLEAFGGGDPESIGGYTQYPALVRTSLKRKVGNLTNAGEYTDEIPYWKPEDPQFYSGRDFDGGAGWGSVAADCPIETMPYFAKQYNPSRNQTEWRVWLSPAAFVTRTYKMKSSIPYRVDATAFIEANTKSGMSQSWHTASDGPPAPGCASFHCMSSTEDGGTQYRNLSPFRVQIGTLIDTQGGTQFEDADGPECFAAANVLANEVETSPDVNGIDIVVTLTSQASGNLAWSWLSCSGVAALLWAYYVVAIGNTTGTPVGYVSYEYDY